MGRERLVVDPRWRKLTFAEFSRGWEKLEQEAELSQYIGFDIEWTTRYEPLSSSNKWKRISEPTAVVQLSTASITIVLRVSDIFCKNWNIETQLVDSTLLEYVWKKLEKILDSNYFKVGVGVNGDKEKLTHDYPFLVARNFVDLASAHVTLTQNSNCLSLKDLSEWYKCKSLDKNLLLIRSKWGSSLGGLSPSQIEYAASDSEVSYDICEKLMRSRESCVVSNEEFLVSLADQKRVIPRPCGSKSNKKEKTKVLSIGRSKPYYDNICVLDPDGELVFTVEKSKAVWYVEKKKLAKVVEWKDDGKGGREISSIQLFFTPNIHHCEDSHIKKNMDYFKTPKDNVCVICGKEEKLARFSVVPLTYRKHFPSVYVSHNSYDLLPLCTKCFFEARKVYDTERNNVAIDFGVPLGDLTTKGLETFKNTIEKFESSIDSQKVKQSFCDDLISHNIHPYIKLKIMNEFFEIQTHRNRIIRIFKFATALFYHYERILKKNELVTENISCQSKSSTFLSAERLNELREYLDSNAYNYPFPFSNSSEYRLVEPSSPEGVKCILQDGGSFQYILRKFWVMKHPEILDETPRRTREEKENSEKGELPMVESHGFLVTRELLLKYTSQGNPTVGKNEEHAIGQFIYRWRSIFLTKLSPKFLPLGWVAEDGILL